MTRVLYLESNWISTDDGWKMRILCESDMGRDEGRKEASMEVILDPDQKVILEGVEPSIERDWRWTVRFPGKETLSKP